MAPYYINLALIGLLALPLFLTKPAKWKKILYLAVTFGYMWFLATFRENIGYDYESYITIFDQSRGMTVPESFKGLLSGGIEPGFLLLNKLMLLFIKTPAQMYGVYSVIMLAPVVWFIYRYCKNVWLSTWLYVTLTFYYTIMNFVRQGMAVSIILLGYKFLREKKAVPFLAVVLAAAMFHKTALIMIPVYFLCHIKLNWKLLAFYGGATLLLFLTSSFIIDFVTDYIFTYYKGTQWIEVGFPILFLFIPAIVFATCLALRTRWEKVDPDSGMLLNLMLFSLIFWIFITRHFIVERFSIYMYIYVIAAMPSALSSLQASPEALEKRDKLAAELHGKKGKASKEQTAALAALNQDISDHKKYYICAVVALVVVSFIYNDYGANVNGFHGVFPYQSIFSWMN